MEADIFWGSNNDLIMRLSWPRGNHLSESSLPTSILGGLIGNRREEDISSGVRVLWLLDYLGWLLWDSISLIWANGWGGNPLGGSALGGERCLVPHILAAQLCLQPGKGLPASWKLQEGPSPVTSQWDMMLKRPPFVSHLGSEWWTLGLRESRYSLELLI